MASEYNRLKQIIICGETPPSERIDLGNIGNSNLGEALSDLCKQANNSLTDTFAPFPFENYDNIKELKHTPIIEPKIPEIDNKKGSSRNIVLLKKLNKFLFERNFKISEDLILLLQERIDFMNSYEKAVYFYLKGIYWYKLALLEQNHTNKTPYIRLDFAFSSFKEVLNYKNDFHDPLLLKDTYYFLGNVLFFLSFYKEAIKKYEKALMIQTEHEHDEEILEMLFLAEEKLKNISKK